MKAKQNPSVDQVPPTTSRSPPLGRSGTGWNLGQSNCLSGVRGRHGKGWLSMQGLKQLFCVCPHDPLPSPLGWRSFPAGRSFPGASSCPSSTGLPGSPARATSCQIGAEFGLGLFSGKNSCACVRARMCMCVCVNFQKTMTYERFTLAGAGERRRCF